MRIAHVVVVAATVVGLSRVFWQPSRCHAGQRSAAHSEVSKRGACRSINGPTPIGTFCALWPVGSLYRFAPGCPLGTRWPGLLRCDSRGAQHPIASWEEKHTHG